MRGTKQANEATAKKLARQLHQFHEHPRSHLPAMTFQGKLSWGRTDPVTKTLREIERIIKKKDDLGWLTKRMMAKRGDPVAKAFAGSLHASHDEQFTLVGQFNSSSFGSASYVRRGDGKPGYLAGIQNFSNLTLRMLPWEEHAKRGMYFFSWEGGFVCTGPNPNPPEEWLEDVLKRSRFEMTKTTIDGVSVWVTEQLNASDVVQGRGGEEGFVTLRFRHGPVVGIDFKSLDSFSKKDASFIHHLALSMLPPILPSILSVEAFYLPKGWPEDKPLPKASTEGIERVIDAWQGLTLNEGVMANAMKTTTLEGIEDGLLIGESWLPGTDVEAIQATLEPFAGSPDERTLTAHILAAAIANPHEDNDALRIQPKGASEQREEGGIRIFEGVTCGDVLTAFWKTHGQQSLAGLGLEGDEAAAIWEQQNTSPKPFGKFLKGLDKAMELARQKARFPSLDSTDGPAAMIHSLTVKGLTIGMGSVEREATGRHDSIDRSAAAWAWLVAVNRSTGQEWHFDSAARDRGGVWYPATQRLHEVGQALLSAKDDDVSEQQEAWAEAFAALRKLTGS
ncbi:MAG: hypothetical protein CMA10_05820 [Euryarchaeota archaeon]|nr:hypothetical protein [Euryarchaeota archaeon]